MNEFLRVPDEVKGADDIFGANYVAMSSPTGAQATAVIARAAGGDANYLTVTVAASLMEGKISNDIQIVSIEGSALSVVYDTYAKELTIIHADNTTLAAINTAVNAVDGFSSALTGTSGAVRAPGFTIQFSGGKDNVRRRAVVSVIGGDAKMIFSTSSTAPGNTSENYFVLNDGDKEFLQLDADTYLYGARIGATDREGSIRIFHDKGVD